MPHGEGAAARQLIADMYGCCSSVLNDPDTLKETAHQAVRMIGAEIVEECVHRFSPVGITYFAVITTSHFPFTPGLSSAMLQLTYFPARPMSQRASRSS